MKRLLFGWYVADQTQELATAWAPFPLIPSDDGEP